MRIIKGFISLEVLLIFRKMGRKLPETITEEEFSKVIKGMLCKTVKHKKKKLAFMLGFYQAMRVSEVVHLTLENVDKGRRLLMIKNAKGGKDRHIPIAPEVINGLKYLPVGIGVRALEVSFKKYGLEVLGKDLHFHLLRHSGATHYLNVKKWDVRYLQQFLGHSKLDTTAIYTHVSPQNLIDKMWEGT